MKVILSFNNQFRTNKPITNSVKNDYNISRLCKKQTITNAYVQNQCFYIPQISFGNRFYFENNYESFFDEQNPESFSINFFNQINSFLTDYKQKVPMEDSCYLINDNQVDKASAKGIVTLTNNAFAKNINTEIADLYGFSKTNIINAKSNAYLFENSSAKSINAKRIFLNDNSRSEQNIANIIWLKDDAIADSINSEKVYQRNFSSSGKVVAKDFYAKDNTKCLSLSTNNIVIKDNAIVNDASVENGKIELYNSAKINNLSVNDSKIAVNKNNEINNITSDSDLTIIGNGTIGNINVNGSHLYLIGPLKINGKINFINQNGVVIAQKGDYNIFPKIDSSGVENGLLQFLMKNKDDWYLGNPADVFSSGIDVLIKQTNHLISEKAPLFSKNKKHIYSVNNDIKIRNLYNDFYKNYLEKLSLNKKNKQTSLFWVKNAKLNNQKIVNLWMYILGYDAQSLSDLQKKDIINNLTLEKRSLLLEKTTDFWFEKVLPNLEKKLGYLDLADYKLNLKKVDEIINILENSSKKDTNYNYILDVISQTELGSKNIEQMWLNVYNPNYRQNIHTTRLQKEFIKNLLLDENSCNRILEITRKELKIQKEFLNSFEYACSDLAENEPELDKVQLKLLEKYKNSKIFYLLIFEATNGKNNITVIESEIIKIINELSKEQNQLAIDARKNIFDKTLNVPNVLIAKNNSDLCNYKNFIFNSLVQNINFIQDEELEDFACQINAFQNYVNKGSHFLNDYWKNFVKIAYDFYKTHTIEDITDNNVSLLYSINKNTRNSEIQRILDNKALDTIEQKEFALRYGNDYNFKKLVNNSGIDIGQVLKNLLMTEAINENLYQERLNAYPKNISPEYVKENLDLTDKYLSLLDKDYSDMTIKEKYKTLLTIPNNDFLLMNQFIFQDWKKHELKSFMSKKFQEIQLQNNINAQAQNISGQLMNINQNLNNIRIGLNGQTYTLNEISSDLNKLLEISKKSFKELYFIGENIEAINSNTNSIKANTRGILYSAMQNAKLRDPQLSKTIENLLPIAEKLPFSEFLKEIEKKHKELKDEKKKQQLKQIASLATIAVTVSTAGAVDPSVITGVLGNSEIVTHVIPMMKSVADTLKHVAIFKAATIGLNK